MVRRKTRGLSGSLYRRDRRFSAANVVSPHRHRVKILVGVGFIAITLVISLACGTILFTGSHKTEEPRRATVSEYQTPIRMYIGSITNESFRVAWYTSSPTPLTGVMMWGPSPESWDTYTGTDVRSSGSEGYQSPSGIHIVQTDFGSGQNMSASTVYWFRIVSGGISYGDNATSDTIYGYGDRISFGFAQPGRPWGISTAPANYSAPYLVSGCVMGPPPLSMAYKNDVLVEARVDDGSSDSLAMLDVSQNQEGHDGAFNIDIAGARRVGSGEPYSPTSGARVKLFFDYGWEGCPTQYESNYPNWTYDSDQTVSGTSPQILHDHMMWYWTGYIPEISGMSLAVVMAATAFILGVWLEALGHANPRHRPSKRPEDPNPSGTRVVRLRKP